MLEHQDELLNIAEISIGIAGFTGLIAAFLQRGGLGEFDRVRFINLFATAFSILLLAYVPIVVAELTESVWFYSSLVLIVFWVFNVAFALVYVTPVINQHAEASGIVPWVLIWIPSVINVLVQICNVTEWFWETNFLAYLFGLFVYVYAACLMFVFLVVYREGDE